MGGGEDFSDVRVGMIVVVQGGLIVAAICTAGGEVAASRQQSIIEVGDVLCVIAIAVEGVLRKGGGHKLHGASGASVGPAGSVAALAGFGFVDGG